MSLMRLCWQHFCSIVLLYQVSPRIGTASPFLLQNQAVLWIYTCMVTNCGYETRGIPVCKGLLWLGSEREIRLEIHF